MTVAEKEYLYTHLHDALEYLKNDSIEELKDELETMLDFIEYEVTT